ncbi:MAG TPA: ribonuclease H, partial [Gemmatimonadales bacterium]|nr:ribonuclease H [Gemmatimonadales bacterium]
LIEWRAGSVVERRDFFISDPDTTNNRMALAGALSALDLLGAMDVRPRALFVSDSEYLVKGIREWAPGWAARGWRRKGGAIENLALWQELAAAAARHDVQWTWVRGHTGHPKNEYANDLAVDAARRGAASGGAVASGFAAWLARERERGRYVGYDADGAFAEIEARLASGERWRLAERR